MHCVHAEEGVYAQGRTEHPLLSEHASQIHLKSSSVANSRSLCPSPSSVVCASTVTVVQIDPPIALLIFHSQKQTSPRTPLPSYPKG